MGERVGEREWEKISRKEHEYCFCEGMNELLFVVLIAHLRFEVGKRMGLPRTCLISSDLRS